ncbi:hypothetical protein [Mesorhizobium sp. CCNWLY176]
MTMHAGAVGRIAFSASPHELARPCADKQLAEAVLSDGQTDGDEQEGRPPRKTFCKIDMTHTVDEPDEGAVPAAPLASLMADSPAVIAIWPVSDKPPNLRRD